MRILGMFLGLTLVASSLVSCSGAPAPSATSDQTLSATPSTAMTTAAAAPSGAGASASLTGAPRVTVVPLIGRGLPADAKLPANTCDFSSRSEVSAWFGRPTKSGLTTELAKPAHAVRSYSVSCVWAGLRGADGAATLTFSWFPDAISREDANFCSGVNGTQPVQGLGRESCTKIYPGGEMAYIQLRIPEDGLTDVSLLFTRFGPNVKPYEPEAVTDIARTIASRL